MPLYDLPLTGRVHGDVGITVNADYTLVVDMLSDVAGIPVYFGSRVVDNKGRLLDGLEIVASDGTSATQRSIFNLPAGLFTGLSVGVIGDLGAVGEVRVRVGLGMRGGGNEATIVIADGYVGGGYNLLWPVTQTFQGDSKRGKLVEITGALPALGVDATIAIPANVTFEVERIFGYFTTDATVVNRTYALSMSFGASIQDSLVAAYATAQTATQTFIYSWCGGYAGQQVQSLTGRLGSLGTFVLPPGSTVFTSIDNLQANDDVGQINLNGWRRFEF